MSSIVIVFEKLSSWIFFLLHFSKGLIYWPFLAANLYLNLTWSDIQADAILNSGMATVKCSYGAFPPAGSVRYE